MSIYCSKTEHQIGNNLASPNVTVQPQRRRSRYMSRDIPDIPRPIIDQPARERRHSQDRRRDSNDINQEWRPPYSSHQNQRHQLRDNRF